MATEEALAFILIAAIAWVVREVITGILAWIRMRRYRRLLRREKTQARFAVARNKLMNALGKEGLSITSETFRVFYYLNTALMRRPDEYREMSEALNKAMLEEGAREHRRLSSEVESWSPATIEAAKATADALSCVAVTYNVILRNAYKLFRRYGYSHFDFFKEMIKEAQKRRAKKEKKKLEREIKRTRGGIESLIRQTPGVDMPRSNEMRTPIPA